jgi:choline kinase
MTAVLLAAGRGSRLYPLTDTQPKAMTQLHGRCLIDYQIDSLRRAGVDDITVITGYRGDMFSADATRYIENADWETTNMVESLFCAEAHFGNDLIVCYGDIVFEDGVIAALLAEPSDTGVVIDRDWRSYWAARIDDPLDDAETLKLGDDGRILEIGQKPHGYDDIEAQYIGLMRFRGPAVQAVRDARARILRGWPTTRPDRNPQKAYMTDLLTDMIENGQRVQGVPIHRGWFEIDTYRDYEVATENLSLDPDGRIAHCR